MKTYEFSMKRTPKGIKAFIKLPSGNVDKWQFLDSPYRSADEFAADCIYTCLYEIRQDAEQDGAEPCRYILDESLRELLNR